MSDKVDREPANRAGTRLKNRLVNSTLPDIKGNFGEFFFERHISCPAFVVWIFSWADECDTYMLHLESL